MEEPQKYTINPQRNEKMLSLRWLLRDLKEKAEEIHELTNYLLMTCYGFNEQKERYSLFLPAEYFDKIADGYPVEIDESSFFKNEHSIHIEGVKVYCLKDKPEVQNV